MIGQHRLSSLLIGSAQCRTCLLLPYTYRGKLLTVLMNIQQDHSVPVLNPKAECLQVEVGSIPHFLAKDLCWWGHSNLYHVLTILGILTSVCPGRGDCQEPPLCLLPLVSPDTEAAFLGHSENLVSWMGSDLHEVLMRKVFWSHPPAKIRPSMETIGHLSCRLVQILFSDLLILWSTRLPPDGCFIILPTSILLISRPVWPGLISLCAGFLPPYTSSLSW